MRTNIEIDDNLMKKVMRVTGAATKKEAVDSSLKLALRIHGQISLRKLRGMGGWQGDLEKSRLAHGEE